MQGTDRERALEVEVAELRAALAAVEAAAHDALARLPRREGCDASSDSTAAA